MTMISDTLVQISNTILSWDGLRNPETRQSGTVNYNVSVLMAQNAPEVAELERICQEQLRTGQFQGTLPAGGNWPLGKIADPTKYGPTYNNHLVVKAGTSRGIPSIIDANLQPLQPMVFGPMLYPGCVMNILVDCWEYSKVNKGIGLGLQGIQIVDATAPVLPVASGMSADAVVKAFGGQAAPAPAGPGAPGAGPSAPPAAPPAAKVLTAAAGPHSYDSYIAAGWTDEKLIAAGYMTA